MDKAAATGLASYAVTEITSRGRRHAEPPPGGRSEFQRDRDRIVHSAAFRRLEYKTQVFVNHEGDLFRTRLTHSIEVAQIARSLARNLRLNEDLTEAIALAHDLGHTPFGHAGQDALNDCMRPYGGFEHNLQSLRVVDQLEQRYAEFDGLNLTFETREGILKHCSAKNAALLGDVGARFLCGRQPSLEAQVANLADEIAYNNHDIDDGLRSGLLSIAQLQEVGLFARYWNETAQAYPDLQGRRMVYETTRRMINALCQDLIATSLLRIQEQQIVSLEDVRRATPLIAFSDSMRHDATMLKRFLFKHLYRHYQVNRMTGKASRIVVDLFNQFMNKPQTLPPDYQFDQQPDLPLDPAEVGSAVQARAAADYIAGMTDRYAIREHRRLFSMDLQEGY